MSKTVALTLAFVGAASAYQAPTMAINTGINGFGRIGRLVARSLIANPETDLKVINSGASNDYMAYQLKYDSVHGRYPGTVEIADDGLIIDGSLVPTMHTRDPGAVGWGKFGADYICESTGAFLTAEKCAPHLADGAKKIIFSAPAKDDSPTVVMGVNQDTYTTDMQFVSCASCTTNGLGPLVKCIDDAFGIEMGLMTTVHAMTATQLVVDGSSKGGKDWRGGRCASANIIPSSTGAAKALTKVMPNLKGKLTGMAFRVPTPDVSVVDLTAVLQKEASYEDICAAVKARSEGDMAGILGYCDEPCVSQDFVSDPRSSIFDAEAGISLNPKFCKVVSWYDNEWGYSQRVVDLMVHMAKEDAKVAAYKKSKTSQKKVSAATDDDSTRGGSSRRGVGDGAEEEKNQGGKEEERGGGGRGGGAEGWLAWGATWAAASVGYGHSKSQSRDKNIKEGVEPTGAVPIGKTKVDVLELLLGKVGHLYDWFPLYGEDGAPCGEVRLGVGFALSAPPRRGDWVRLLAAGGPDGAALLRFPLSTGLVMEVEDDDPAYTKVMVSYYTPEDWKCQVELHPNSVSIVHRRDLSRYERAEAFMLRTAAAFADSETAQRSWAAARGWAAAGAGWLGWGGGGGGGDDPRLGGPE